MLVVLSSVLLFAKCLHFLRKGLRAGRSCLALISVCNNRTRSKLRITLDGPSGRPAEGMGKLPSYLKLAQNLQERHRNVYLPVARQCGIVSETAAFSAIPGSWPGQYPVDRSCNIWSFLSCVVRMTVAKITFPFVYSLLAQRERICQES